MRGNRGCLLFLGIGSIARECGNANAEQGERTTARAHGGERVGFTTFLDSENILA